jgi:hypothetical protein
MTWFGSSSSSSGGSHMSGSGQLGLQTAAVDVAKAQPAWVQDFHRPTTNHGIKLFAGMQVSCVTADVQLPGFTESQRLVLSK